MIFGNQEELRQKNGDRRAERAEDDNEPAIGKADAQVTVACLAPRVRWEVVSPDCPIREALSRSESRLERSWLWQAIQENVKYPDRRIPLPLMRALQFVPQFGKDGHG